MPANGDLLSPAHCIPTATPSSIPVFAWSKYAEAPFLCFSSPLNVSFVLILFCFFLSLCLNAKPLLLFVVLQICSLYICLHVLALSLYHPPIVVVISLLLCGDQFNLDRNVPSILNGRMTGVWLCCHSFYAVISSNLYKMTFLSLWCPCVFAIEFCFHMDCLSMCLDANCPPRSPCVCVIIL